MALGRGLGELLGEIEEAYNNEIPSNDKILDLSLTNIKPNPYQPRKTFEQNSLIELSESIKEHGLLQPIVVVEDIDGYILVAGERRWRASKLAKTKTIKAVVAKITTDQMRQHALIENIQREELNAIELSYAYEELLKVHEITHEELSHMINKSRTHITNTIRLLQLSKKAQNSLSEGKITAGHAKVLVSLSDKEQSVIVDSIIGQKLSVRDVENMLKQMRNSDIKDKTVEKKVPTLNFNLLKNRLSDFGYKSSVKANKLTIEFSDDADIDSFLNQFS